MSKMEKKVGKDVRSVIRLGDSLAITLPSEYVRANSIKKGDKVELLFDRELVARPLKQEELRKTLLKIEEEIGEN